MACFSCSQNKSMNTVSILLMYKEAYEKTGNIYWFFTDPLTKEIKVTDDESFKKFTAANKKKFTKGEIEFARIDEFRIAEGSSILEDSGDEQHRGPEPQSL